MRGRWAVWGAVLAVAGSLPVAALLRAADAATTPVPCLATPAQSGQALSVAFAQADTAPGEDTLELGACSYQVTQPLAATAADTLTVHGVAGSVVTGGDATQVFRVAAGAHLVLSNLTVSGGNAATDAGGAVNNAGILEVLDSTLTANSAFDGGAIWSSGTATVARSLLRGNTATGEVGTDGRGRDIALSTGNLSLVNSTLLQGTGIGALHVLSGRADVAGSTFASFTNYAIYNSDGIVSLILNAISSAAITNCYGPIDDGGSNVVSDASCGTVAGTGSVSGVDPRLLPLADNGGATLTMLPGPGSPAIGVGRGSLCDAAGFEDARQRGRPQGAECDAGATESAARSQSAVSGPSFESTPVGTQRTRKLTVVSQGADPLTLGTAALSGAADMAITDDSCSGRTLADGQSCAVSVTYRPTSSTGTSSAELRLPANAADGGITSTLTGSGASAPAPTPPPTRPPPTAPPTTAPPTAPPTTAPPTAPPTTAPPTTPPTSAPGPSTAPPTPPTPTTAPPTAPPTTSAPAPSRTPLLAVPTTPADPRRPRPEEGASEPDLYFASYVPPPSEVSTTLTTVIGSSLLALLLLALLSLPVTVVNDTLSAHREDIAAQLAGLRARLAFIPRLRHERLHPAVVLGVAAAGAAVINSFLDPGFGWNRGSAIDFLGLLGSLVLVSAVGRLAADQWCERRLRADTVMRLIPGFWLLAVTCVALSRTTGFRPGLLLGTLATVQVTRTLNAQEEGQKTAFAYVVTAVVSLLAWLAYEPVSHYIDHTEAGGQHAGFGMLVLQTVLATVFLGGVGGSLFGLVPLDFLDGGAVREWSFRVWFVLFFAALFGFVHVLMRSGPGDDPLLRHLRYLEVLLAIYLVCAAAFWGYWKRREARTG